MRMKVKFIDLFCGAGGMTLGFERAGARCIGGVELSKAACVTHSKNFPHCKVLNEDICNLKPEEFKKRSKIENEVDIIVGGPPCPTFSTIGQAKIKSVGGNVDTDKRNKLFVNFLEYVNFFQPQFFVMENVPNFLTKNNGAIFQTTKNMIKNLKGNYKIIEPVQILNSVNYGVPQTRRRMILIGCKTNYSYQYPKITHHNECQYNEQFELFDKTNKLKPPVTLFDAISDLPIITDDWRIDQVKYSRNNKLSCYQRTMREKTSNTVRNNRCRLTNDRAKILFKEMKQGSKYMDLPKEIRKILPFREDIFKDRLKKLSYNKPSWTIIAHLGMDGYMFIHPEQIRTISVREAARIQSFPDDFIFYGNMTETFVQIGNAVPCILAEKIATAILRALNK